jgi:hypothetical protein
VSPTVADNYCDSIRCSLLISDRCFNDWLYYNNYEIYHILFELFQRKTNVTTIVKITLVTKLSLNNDWQKYYKHIM